MNIDKLSELAYYKNNFGYFINDDCLSFMKKLDDCCIDLTVTSPPYDNLRKYNGYYFDFEKRKYMLTDEAPKKAVESYNEYYKTIESVKNGSQ